LLKYLYIISANVDIDAALIQYPKCFQSPFDA